MPDLRGNIDVLKSSNSQEYFQSACEIEVVTVNIKKHTTNKARLSVQHGIPTVNYNPKEDNSSIVGAYTEYDKITIKNYRMKILMQ